MKRRPPLQIVVRGTAPTDSAGNKGGPHGGQMQCKTDKSHRLPAGKYGCALTAWKNNCANMVKDRRRKQVSDWQS